MNLKLNKQKILEPLAKADYGLEIWIMEVFSYTSQEWFGEL